MASLLMELLTLQMLAEELSSSVKWETLMEIEDILYLNSSSTPLLLGALRWSQQVWIQYISTTHTMWEQLEPEISALEHSYLGFVIATTLKPQENG